MKSTTMKQLKNHGRIVLGVPYCQLQHVLMRESRDGFNSTTRWNCDQYIIDGEYSIVTGYNYSRACTYDLTTDKQLSDDLVELEQQCMGNTDMSRDARRIALIAILDKHFK